LLLPSIAWSGSFIEISWGSSKVLLRMLITGGRFVWPITGEVRSERSEEEGSALTAGSLPWVWLLLKALKLFVAPAV
jgi:hypothetical protein